MRCAFRRNQPVFPIQTSRVFRVLPLFCCSGMVLLHPASMAASRGGQDAAAQQVEFSPLVSVVHGLAGWC